MSALFACTRPPALAAPACPDETWRPAATSDSTIALCLAPGFASTGEGRRWARGKVGDSSYAWLTVVILDSVEAEDEWGSPPVPRSFRAASPPAGTIHALTAESIAVYRDTVDGQPVEVETALISGGFADLRRQPAIRAAWRLPSGRWVLAQGLADRPAEIDILRAMLRTVKLAADGQGSRPAT